MRIFPIVDPPRRAEDLVDPRLLARLDRLDLRSGKVFAGKLQGERRSKRRGQSVEFDDYRRYVRGDDPRFIDWNVFARLDRLFIKIFLEEEDLALHLAIDASTSMHAGPGDAQKLRFAARLAMALGYVGLVKQNRVGISVFGRPAAPGRPPVAVLADTRGRRQVQRLGSFLAETLFAGGTTGEGAGPAPGGGFGDALHRIAATRTGKGVLLVVSDFLVPEGYESGLRALAAAGGYDVTCLQVLAPAELEPDATLGGVSGDLRLTDVETGRSAEVTVTPELLKRYRARLEEHCEALRSFCAARGMDHLLLRSDTDLETLLLDTLRRRGLIG